MLKLNVGLSRKVGEPNYGSRGAAPQRHTGAEHGAANGHRDTGTGCVDRSPRQDQAHRATVNGHRPPAAARLPDAAGHCPDANMAGHDQTSTGHGHSGQARSAATNGRRGNGGSDPAVDVAGGTDAHTSREPPGNSAGHPSVRPATAAQIQAIHTLAARRGIDLAAELQRRFGINRPASLTRAAAADFIDSLQAPLSGRRQG